MIQGKYTHWRCLASLGIAALLSYELYVLIGYLTGSVSPESNVYVYVGKIGSTSIYFYELVKHLAKRIYERVWK
jgi:hypothetical protein